MSFLLTLGAVAPLFLLIFCGVLLRVLLKPDARQTSFVNRICYTLFLPCSLFQSARGLDISMLSDPKLYLYGAGTFIIAAVAVSLLTIAATKEPKKAAAFAHSALRPNAALLGIPLATSLVGETDAQSYLLLCVVLLPLFTMLGVSIVTLFLRQNGNKVTLWQIAKPIVTNPLIIAVALGLLFSWLAVPLPAFVTSPIRSLAACATPAAMLCIGFGLSLGGLRRDGKLIVLASAIKIVLLPVVFTLLAVLLGFRGAELFAIYLIHALPTAANSGVITGSLGGDGELAGEITVTSTIAFCVMLLLGVSLLRAAGLL